MEARGGEPNGNSNGESHGITNGGGSAKRKAGDMSGVKNETPTKRIKSDEEEDDDEDDQDEDG